MATAPIASASERFASLRLVAGERVQAINPDLIPSWSKIDERLQGALEMGHMLGVIWVAALAAVLGLIFSWSVPAMAVIGGVSLSGGRGSIVGTVLGALIFGVIGDRLGR